MGGFGHQGSHPPAHVPHAPELLGGREEDSRIRHARLGGAHERLEPVHRRVLRPHDGLVGHPQREQGSREDVFDITVARRLSPRAFQVLQGLTTQRGAPPQDQSSSDRIQEGLRGHGLHEVLKGSMPDGLDRRFEAGPPRHEDDGEIGVLLVHLLQELDTVTPGHADVGNHEVEVALPQGRQGPLGVAGRGHREPALLQDVREERAEIGLVVGHEHVPGHARLPASASAGSVALPRGRSGPSLL